MKQLTGRQRKAAITILKLGQTIGTKSQIKSNLELQTKLRFTDVVNEDEWQLVNVLIKKLNK
jgi:hypothetical protein